MERRIYITSGSAIVLAMAALVMPRLAAQGDEGMAAAATAAITFLLLIGVSAVVSAVLAAITWARRNDLSRAARIAGIAPLIIILITMIGVWLLVRG